MLLNAANATVTAFTLSELLRENQLGKGGGGVNLQEKFTGKIIRKN